MRKLSSAGAGLEKTGERKAGSGKGGSGVDSAGGDVSVGAELFDGGRRERRWVMSAAKAGPRASRDGS